METFERLASIDVNEHTEKKNGLTYLSWAWAWDQFKRACPDAVYEIYRDPQTNLPYMMDPDAGYMVFTKVTAAGETHEMWLPVMDFRNKAIKIGEATMFEINKTIMRCLVKNLAMFGLGLYIYAGEDMPEAPIAGEEVDASEPAPVKKPAPTRAPAPPAPAPAPAPVPAPAPAKPTAPPKTVKNPPDPNAADDVKLTEKAADDIIAWFDSNLQIEIWDLEKIAWVGNHKEWTNGIRRKMLKMSQAIVDSSNPFTKEDFLAGKELV